MLLGSRAIQLLVLYTRKSYVPAGRKRKGGKVKGIFFWEGVRGEFLHIDRWEKNKEMPGLSKLN